MNTLKPNIEPHASLVFRRAMSGPMPNVPQASLKQIFVFILVILLFLAMGPNFCNTLFSAGFACVDLF